MNRDRLEQEDGLEPDLREEIAGDEPQGPGCLTLLLRSIARLLVFALALLFTGTVVGALPGEILAVTRPIVAETLGLFGIELGPPPCAEAGVREVLTFCRLFD